MSNRPSDIGGCKDGLSWLAREHVSHRSCHRHRIAACIAWIALGPGGCPGCVKKIACFATLQPDRGNLFAKMVFPKLGIIEVPPWLRGHLRIDLPVADENVRRLE